MGESGRALFTEIGGFLPQRTQRETQRTQSWAHNSIFLTT